MIIQYDGKEVRGLCDGWDWKENAPFNGYCLKHDYCSECSINFIRLYRGDKEFKEVKVISGRVMILRDEDQI